MKLQATLRQSGLTRNGMKWTLIDTDKLNIMPENSITLSNGYAQYWDGKTMQLLHRLIMGFPELDHRYGEKRDNRRENLREATGQQNDMNRKPQGGSSDYKGVCWYKPTGKWLARIRVNGELLYLGYFTDEIEAAWAYDRAAIFYFGEFARPNFMEAVCY